MAQVFTGARARIKLKDTVVGFAGGINVTIENTLTDVDVLGQLEVGDLAETGHKCNFSVNYFKLVDNQATLNADGKVVAKAEISNAIGIGVDSSATTDDNGNVSASSLAGMRNQAYFNAEILDDLTDKVIFVMQNCKYEGGTGQVDARGLWQGTWNFRAQKGFGI